jgi:hypothetical protein
MMKNVVSRLGHLFTIVCVLICSPAHAQFGDLLKKLSIEVPAKPAMVAPGGAVATSGASNEARSGGITPSDQWCAQASGALGNMKVDTALITSEFKVKELISLQDEFLLALEQKQLSKTFPNAAFFSASFETKRVRAIYDTFLAFPEPDTLAALIQISRSKDDQDKIDGLMALVYLHLQAPALSITPNRWKELYQQAVKVPHYTSLLFKGRIATYGELGPKDLTNAMASLNQANGLKSEYAEMPRSKREFDYQNYEIQLYSAMRDIQKDPSLPPNLRKPDSPLGDQILQAQTNFEKQFPRMRVGKLSADAQKFNDKAESLGDSIIGKSQEGNQFEGGKASYKSLAAEGGSTYVSVDPVHNARLLKAFGEQATFSDAQKALLKQAQEQRMAAQGLIAQAQQEIGQIMSNAMNAGFVQMTAPLPALKAVNNALIKSCMITSKWEQAMRSKDIPKADPKVAESALGDANSMYK